MRANARTLPEATERHLQSDLTNNAIQDLAVDFEAAWATESVIYNGKSATDDEAAGAIGRVRDVVKKIVALHAMDLALMRLKARAYLWSESTDFEAYAAENEGSEWSEGVLVSLFRDLGADRTVEGSMTIPEAASMHFEPLSADDLELCKPPTEEQWRLCRTVMRLGHHMLGKTKDELKSAARTLQATNEDEALFEQIETVVDILKDNVKMLEAAHARHLTACASVVEEQNTQHEEVRP